MSSLAGADVALRNVAIACVRRRWLWSNGIIRRLRGNSATASAAPGSATPAAAPGEQEQSSLGARTGNDALYASELLTLVGEQVRRDVTRAKHGVALADAATKRGEPATSKPRAS